MSADISRVRFDPLRDFAGVVLQQGRLLLDADFNELVALLDRRLRAETCDLTSFGPDPNHAGVAWVPRQTPDGFLVTLTGGVLSIGRGRMYVDGLLAENHGVELDGFDDLLREVTGNADMPYLQQPYWPTPAALPTGGTHLAYIDVWQREVTHLEDPHLVEIAVGVDATARWQTAWQVRLLPVPTGSTCATSDEDLGDDWTDLIAPSGGRLTTDTVDVEDEDDPCELPPGSGYRGLENQTYRVEIHEGGAPGTATFKWSRENASVATPVVEMVLPTVLRLASVGRDDVLRISTNDWVEIINDKTELNGDLGDIRKVTVDDAERTITFTGALSPNLQPANADDAAARHLRVRRWDQSGVVKDADGNQLIDLDAGSVGVITVPASDATQVMLEHGVVVSFSLAASGGAFRRGDHWIFAARTADASIELLDAAPPLGVHHHYARLGILTFPDTESDCRRLWPPLPTEGEGESCDCTVCVTVESHSSGALTIQDAIAIVKGRGGGTVCIDVGVYDIGPGVEVDGVRSVRIHGQGPATILVARGEALTITNSVAVTVENLAVVAGASAPGAVRVRGVALVDLHDLVVLSYGTQDTGGAAVELSGVGLLVSLRRNVLAGRRGIAIGGGDNLGFLAAGLRVEDNLVLAGERGIDIGGTAAYLYECRVTGNDVLGPRDAGIVATGAVAPGGSLEVTGNKLAARGPGILVGADALVDANTVNPLGNDTNGDGVAVTGGTLAVKPGDVRITGNRVHDRGGNGIALHTVVRSLMVKQNVITETTHGFQVMEKGAAERLVVENNQILDSGFGEGIFAFHARSASVIGNTVARVEGPGVVECGIFVMACDDVQVSHNVVDEPGAEHGQGFGAGIAIEAPFGRVIVSDNLVSFGPESPPATGAGGWHALLIETPSSDEGTTIFSGRAAVDLGNETVVLTAANAFAAATGAGHVDVNANALRGGGNRPTCRVRIRGDIVAVGNQCDHATAPEPTGVFLGAGGSVTASTNRVRGVRAGLVLVAAEDRWAAVGNLAAGGTHFGSFGNGIPNPWKPLNPTVS